MIHYDVEAVCTNTIRHQYRVTTANSFAGPWVGFLVGAAFAVAATAAARVRQRSLIKGSPMFRSSTL